MSSLKRKINKRIKDSIDAASVEANFTDKTINITLHFKDNLKLNQSKYVQEDLCNIFMRYFSNNLIEIK